MSGGTGRVWPGSVTDMCCWWWWWWWMQLAARNKWLLRLRPSVGDHQQFASARCRGARYNWDCNVSTLIIPTL